MDTKHTPEASFDDESLERSYTKDTPHDPLTFAVEEMIETLAEMPFTFRSTRGDVEWLRQARIELDRLQKIEKAARAGYCSLRTFSPYVPEEEQGWTSYDSDALEALCAALDGEEEVGIFCIEEDLDDPE